VFALTFFFLLHVWTCFYRDSKKQIFLTSTQSRIVAIILAQRGIPNDKTNTYLTRYIIRVISSVTPNFIGCLFFIFLQVYWLFIEYSF